MLYLFYSCRKTIFGTSQTANMLYVDGGFFVDFKTLTVKEVHLMIFWCAVVKAYQYTSITSIMLLDCWSIPSVIFLTWFFLKTKYRLRKAIGVAICVVGLVVVVFSDVHAKDRSGKRMLFYAIFFDFVLWFICFCYSDGWNFFLVAIWPSLLVFHWNTGFLKRWCSLVYFLCLCRYCVNHSH